MPDTAGARTTVERTAIIDVGSNSVRLVIFGDNRRAPLTMLNERAFCSLGRGMSATGRLNPEGVESAIATLKRFHWMIQVTGAEQVIGFATAAVRDAADGAAFVNRVRRECGIGLEVLSGRDEARLAATGVLFGIPEADGIVGDLGGSSLELAPVRGREVHSGVTLPVGPLRFDGSDVDDQTIRGAVTGHLRSSEWLRDWRGTNLYVVGGTWRALAKLDIRQRNYPLHVVHGYEMPVDRALDLIRLVARQSPESLEGADGISGRRLQVLPVAARVLEAVLTFMAPKRLVFSAHGVREGAYFDGLSQADRDRDPLISVAEAMALQEARFGTGIGLEIFDWCQPLFRDEGAGQGRLRLVASLLSDIGWRLHPDYRATHAFRRVLRAPMIGVSHADRAFIATAVLRRYSHRASGETVTEIGTLLSEDEAGRASLIGAAVRLAQTLSCGAPGALKGSSIELQQGRLILRLPAHLRELAGDTVESRLKRLARHLAAAPEIVAI